MKNDSDEESLCRAFHPDCSEYFGKEYTPCIPETAEITIHDRKVNSNYNFYAISEKLKTLVLFSSNWNFGWSLLMSTTRIFDNFAILIQARVPLTMFDSVFSIPIP